MNRILIHLFVYLLLYWNLVSYYFLSTAAPVRNRTIVKENLARSYVFFFLFFTFLLTYLNHSFNIYEFGLVHL